MCPKIRKSHGQYPPYSSQIPKGKQITPRTFAVLAMEWEVDLIPQPPAPEKAGNVQIPPLVFDV